MPEFIFRPFRSAQAGCVVVSEWFAAVKAVWQFVEFLVASQHSPTWEPVHLGPPAASVALTQFLPVPTFLQQARMLELAVKQL